MVVGEQGRVMEERERRRGKERRKREKRVSCADSYSYPNHRQKCGQANRGISQSPTQIYI